MIEFANATAKIAFKQLLGASILGSAWIVAAPSAIAQSNSSGDQPVAAAESQGLEEVIVTARKRSEKLQDVPEAITAVTSGTIDQRNILSLNDIAKITPSFTIANYGAERVSRNIQTLTTRGVSSGGTGIFINGAPAINGAAADISDLERVEVLKGPQSAYFGRATFAGAINYVTRTPSEAWRAKVDGLVGSDDWNDFKGSIEGPIIPGVLSFRVNARHFSESGQYHSAYDGKTLDDQETTSVSGVFDYHGLDNLKATWTVLYRENNDGPSAYAKFNALNGDFNCNAGGVTTGKNFICGQLPGFPLNRVGADFPLTPAMQDILFLNTLNVPNPSGLTVDVRGPGAISRTIHSNLHLDYTIDGTGTPLDGATLTYVGSGEDLYGAFLTNSEGQTTQGLAINPNFALGRANVFTNYPYYEIVSASESWDMYHELRLSSDASERFRFTQGISYFFSSAAVGLIYGLVPTGLSNFGGTGNTSTTENWGAFGSVAYDILPDLTATFDWRYQVDHLTIDTHYPPAHQFASDLDPEFMPRGSIQYKIDPTLTTYASFAVGINPQAFNSTLFGLAPSILATITSATGAGLVVKGERLEMWEAGLKGSLFDGMIAFDTDIYYGDWTNQVVSQPVIALITPTSTQTTIYRPSTNLGRTEIYGYELQGAAKITSKLTANITLGVNKTQVDSYNCQACISITGSTNVKGNSLNGVPEVTASAFLEYRDALPWGSDLQWYANTQYIHTDGVFTDLTNVAYSGPRNTFDFRVGVQSDRWTVEGFVMNAFDDHYYTSANRDTDLTGAATNAIYVGLPALRQFGIRMHYEFGLASAETATAASYTPPPVVAPAASVPKSYLVFFDFNKSDLTGQAVAIVDQAARNAGPAKVTKLEVTGHTDTVGSDAYNLRLSRRRAESVAAQLEKDGIPSSAIEIVAKGKRDLLVPTADGVKEPQNRRVQIVYEGGSTS